MRGFVKIAYWDTEKNAGQSPPVLGEIRGTPTIKLVRPKRKAKTNKSKDVVDYNMERKADDMASFSLDLMPTFVERIAGNEEFIKFKNKASKYGLPMMLFFSEDRRILNEMKYLSTEFRRRVLVGQIPFTKKENKNLFFEYGVRGQALVVVPSDGGNSVTFDGKLSLHRLKTFFSEHSLKEEVKPVNEEEKKEPKTEEQKKEKVKTEL